MTDETPEKSEPSELGHDFILLLRAAKSGSQQAMNELIRISQPYLMAIANAEMKTDIAAKVGASDIVQTSMLSAQRCIGDFTGESREELLAWLRGILIKDLKQAHRHYRAAKRNVSRELPLADGTLGKQAREFVDLGDSPSAAAALKEQEMRLHRAMETLSETEREVIELRNWQRLSFGEIGQRMERSADAARKLWSRAIVRLQKQMDGQDD